MIASNMTVDFCSAAQDGPSLLRYSRLGKHGSGSGEVDTKRSFRDLAGERLETWRPHGHGIRSQYEGSHMFSNSGHEARSLPPRPVVILVYSSSCGYMRPEIPGKPTTMATFQSYIVQADNLQQQLAWHVLKSTTTFVRPCPEKPRSPEP